MANVSKRAQPLPKTPDRSEMSGAQALPPRLWPCGPLMNWPLCKTVPSPSKSKLLSPVVEVLGVLRPRPAELFFHRSNMFCLLAQTWFFVFVMASLFMSKLRLHDDSTCWFPCARCYRRLPPQKAASAWRFLLSGAVDVVGTKFSIYIRGSCVPLLWRVLRAARLNAVCQTAWLLSGLRFPCYT